MGLKKGKNGLKMYGFLFVEISNYGSICKSHTPSPRHLYVLAKRLHAPTQRHVQIRLLILTAMKLDKSQ